jgi:hypothetical protein
MSDPLGVRGANINTSNAAAHSRAKSPKYMVIRLENQEPTAGCRRGYAPQRRRRVGGANCQEIYLLDNQTLAALHGEGPRRPDLISKRHIDTVFGYLYRDMAPL